MIELTMYGQQTSVYEYVKMMLLQNTKKAKIDLRLKEVNDWTEIVKEKIPSLPTIRLNNHIDMSYTESQNVNEFVHQLTTKILKEENYGEMIKMIVPTDFSDTATNALVYAHNLSQPINGMIKVVHVYRPEVVQIDNIAIVDKEVEELKKKQLEEFVSKINRSWIGASSGYTPMESEFKVGFVADEVYKICTEPFNRNLIVVGSTGTTDNLKKFFGSVSLQLIKRSPSPVLVIPPKTTYNGIDNILYAVASIEKDMQSSPAILDFADMMGATVHLVHVNTKNEVYPSQTLLDRCKNLNPKVEVVYQEIDSTDVISTIDDYVIDNKIDMVSLTTFDRGFLSDLFHKSVTRKMAIHTDIPLLIIHA